MPFLFVVGLASGLFVGALLLEGYKFLRDAITGYLTK